MTGIIQYKPAGGRSITLMIALMLTAILSVGAASAYFISSAAAENQVTVKDNTIRINETVEYPDEIQSGKVTIFPKTVSVQNTGSSACDVTVTVQFSTSDMEKITNLDLNLGNGEEQWTDLEGGKFRYNSRLAPGDETSPLFTTVTVTSENATDKIEDFQIYVYAESYNQSKNL